MTNAKRFRYLFAITAVVAELLFTWLLVEEKISEDSFLYLQIFIIFLILEFLMLTDKFLSFLQRKKEKSNGKDK